MQDFTIKLQQSIDFFEQVLKALPDDPVALELLAAVYSYLGQHEKAEEMQFALARVRRQEQVGKSAAEPPLPSDFIPVATTEGNVAALAIASEASLAEELGESALAERLRKSPVGGKLSLVSALAGLAKENPSAAESALRSLADRYGVPPVPLEAFEPEAALVKRIPEELLRVRGVIPFARLGDWALVALLSPQDSQLRNSVSKALGGKVQFYLGEPRAVTAALAKLFPEAD